MRPLFPRRLLGEATVKGQWGQTYPFDKSLAGPKAQGFDNSGPWHRVFNLTRFPLVGLSGD
jgi:hypothetical protein